MRIVRVDVVRVALPLVAPYAIAYDAVDSAENLFVRIVTEASTIGLGCAAPEASVTGETHDACEAALRDAAGALVGADPLMRMACLERVHLILLAAPAARAAIDMALLDLLGRVAGLPLFQLLGGTRTCIPTSVTVYLGSPEEMAVRAVDYVAQGFEAIKLKGGRDVAQDVEVVRVVRAAVGPDVELRFDANQGWTLDEALWFVDRTNDAGLELLEQPVPRDAGMGRVTAHAPIPVMADESLLDLADAFRLAKGGLVDMVNVKLMKVGGIEAAMAVNAVARAAGYEVMVGCMDESALAIAAGLHFALARGNVMYADLDGHLDLVDDPAHGAVRLERGTLFPTGRPGLGLPDLDAVYRHAAPRPARG